eukprot:6202136-Pleurochrysis_carterae.AAC.1
MKLAKQPLPGKAESQEGRKSSWKRLIYNSTAFGGYRAANLRRRPIGAGRDVATRARTRAATVRERVQARGLSAPTVVAPVKRAQRAAMAVRERVFQSLGSGARALRKYACGATANISETMHASDEMGRATIIARTVRRARVKEGPSEIWESLNIIVTSNRRDGARPTTTMGA